MDEHIKRSDALNLDFSVKLAPDKLEATMKGMAIYADQIKLIPAADVAPVVHGHWIDTNNYYQRWKCSICGNHTRDAGPNYCPNCGARMDEGYKYDPSRHFAHFVMTED